MSASLVGSEMCIRDSQLMSQNGHLGKYAHGDKQSFRAPGPSNEECPECCLLYTSDAADDM
eukprot:9216382-Alexandrium_andersonii.AAC.1